MFLKVASIPYNAYTTKVFVYCDVIFMSQHEKSLHVFSGVNFHAAGARVVTLLPREIDVANFSRGIHVATIVMRYS